MHRYSIVVFLGAFLLFQVQPLIAKVILPWFGGTAAVWNTCMMFFQIVLLLGYLYSHGLRMLTKPRTSWIVHSVVLLLALLMIPVLPSENLKPENYTSLSGEIVRVLALSVGVPFFILATTGPLIQAWQSVSHGGSESESSASPYRLYALSNIGSLLALISYPFLFEPNLRLQDQSWLWSGLFVRASWRHESRRRSNDPLVDSGDDSIGDVVGNDQPDVPGNSISSLPVDLTVGTLLDLIHHLF